MTIGMEILDSPERLQAFRGDWQHFLNRVPAPTPFQTPEWLLTWWSHFGSGRPHFMVFRTDSVAGVVPAFHHEWNGRRQLTLMGAGISDYLDPVLDTRYSEAIVEALQSHLSQFPEWDVCDWQDLSADTPLQALGETCEDSPCSEVAVTGFFGDFLKQRPARLRRNLRHSAAKGAALGSLRFTVSARADRGLLNSLIQLHGARWRDTGEAGAIAQNRSANFLRDAATALAQRNMLRIFALWLDSRVVAIVLALRNETTIFSYLTGFDPEYKKYCFGAEALALSVRHAYENGYQRWDFLRGDEPYKSDWGAARIPKRRLILER